LERILGISGFTALLCLSVSARAQTEISFAKVEDRSPEAICNATAVAKPKLAEFFKQELERRLADSGRFFVAPAESHGAFSVVSTINHFEVCDRRNRVGQDAELEVNVNLMDSSGKMTHMFTSRTKVSHSARSLAASEAVRMVVYDLVDKIDKTVPGPRGGIAQKDLDVQMLPARWPAAAPGK
jgi:hypothetical protein